MNTAGGLWPQPLSYAATGGELSLTASVALRFVDSAAAWSSSIRSRLAWLTTDESHSNVVTVSVLRDDNLVDEEFVLDITSQGIEIRAGGEAGAGHACVSLRQLLPADAHRPAPVHRSDWVLPHARIHDAPAFAWRGFMLDVARHFAPKDELLRVIDRMAMHRLNRLHLHLTDDQGWRIESTAYPEIARVASWREASGIGMIPFDGSNQETDGTPHGGFYTLDDLREITAYARRLGITVVPEIDLPAHASALLAAVPEVRVPGAPVPTVATTFLPSGRVVSPLPPAREVLRTLLTELAAAVDSPYIHIGGDEASLADWDASPEVNAYMAERGLDDVEALRRDFNAFLIETVESLGRRAIVWEEAFIAGGVSPSTVVMSWRGEAAGLVALQAGHDVVMMPMPGNYLDYAEGGSDEPLALGGGQGIGRVAGYTPTRIDGPGKLLGVQAALWTEFVPDARLRSYKMFPRLAVHSANAWTGQATEWPKARPELEHHLSRLDAAGVEYRPLDGPHPWQRGGTGRRQHTSPLTIDMIIAMAAAMAQGSGAPDLEELAKLMNGEGNSQAD